MVATSTDLRHSVTTSTGLHHSIIASASLSPLPATARPVATFASAPARPMAASTPPSPPRHHQADHRLHPSIAATAPPGRPPPPLEDVCNVFCMFVFVGAGKKE
ncbi:hypothetical protein GUJ93_ZPchr0012g21608 [Zizania palustris]|uniref:Uncharacterized protein n=1 Tax=Zizania palustris TaxID=103762 RepID=A0A8J6BPU2_ZIZPA|nr:hypothetical protein GUJ93_ZPchr0012g21608 [Zizania palustris]